MNDRPPLAAARTAVGATQPQKPIDAVRYQLDQMGREFSAVLPQHIPVDRFRRVVMTAMNQNPDLLLCDRRSLLNACVRAAQDGLMPDGREGALVIFNTTVKVENETGGVQERRIKGVQWMPMVYGIIKKMRNSGELASIVSHEVYERDEFRYRLGDDESIEHVPYLGGDEPGKMIAVYAIAKLKDGTIQREVMTRAQVEKVRAVSRAGGNGPWVSWYEEMARKSVVRRLSKYLPMSTEIEDLLRRDDAIAASADTMSFRSGIDDHAGPAIEADPSQALVEDKTAEEFDPETGEVRQPATAETADTAEQRQRKTRADAGKPRGPRGGQQQEGGSGPNGPEPPPPGEERASSPPPPPAAQQRPASPPPSPPPAQQGDVSDFSEL